MDHRERQIAPHSLAFNLTAQKLVVILYLFQECTKCPYRLYCGFEDAIEVFDLSRPGEGTRLHTTPSKKSKDGLKGQIFITIASLETYNCPSHPRDPSPLWRFPHHIAQMNVFTLQAVLPRQIPTSQCSAMPKKSLSCTSAVALVQVSPRYAAISYPS